MAPPRTAVFRVAGMDCPSEGRLVDAALDGCPGATDWITNYLEQTVTVHLDPEADVAEVERRLGTTGLAITRVDETAPAAPPPAGRDHALALHTAVAAALVLAAGVADWYGLGGWSRGLYAAAIVGGGVPTARKALTAVRHRRLDMHVLMTVAVLGAVGIGEWLEGAVVVVLFALANTLEAMSLAHARASINALLDLTPPRATVRQDGADVTVAADEVRVDDVVIIKAGERLPVDGVVVGGRSDVNQAPVTGESRLVAKGEGDTVFAGTLNAHGVLEVRATRPASDSTPARIRHLIEEAQATRAPVQRFVDRFAAGYTPAVVGLAVLVALVPPLMQGGAWGAWFYRALVLLVIACPCALVISTPVTLVSHLSAAARRGILIKGGAHLENLAKVCSMVFDKTGTLTTGKPRVACVRALNGATEADVLRYAAAVESRVAHPLAPVICGAARDAGLAVPPAANPHTHPGMGVHATVDGRELWVGTLAMARGDSPRLAEAAAEVRVHEAHGETVVVLGEGAEPLGVLALADTVREEAAGAVAALRAAGLHHLYMLTGDNRTVADGLAQELGLDGAFAELLPEQKVAEVRRLLAEEHTVAMVGDGINDAPALAAATVGIAMGAGGSDVALETADVALVGDDLRGLPAAVHLARRTMRTVRQNVAIALGLKGLVLALALGGIATLWLAILADMGASLLVIANALRPLAAVRT